MGSFTGIPKSKDGGIYMILNVDNGKSVYIGQTRNFHKRAQEHKNALLKGIHSNKAMQADFDTGNRMKFVALEVVDSEMSGGDRRSRELLYMSTFKKEWYQLYNEENNKNIESMLMCHLIYGKQHEIKGIIHKNLGKWLHNMIFYKTKDLEIISNRQIE